MGEKCGFAQENGVFSIFAELQAIGFQKFLRRKTCILGRKILRLGPGRMKKMRWGKWLGKQVAEGYLAWQSTLDDREPMESGQSPLPIGKDLEGDWKRTEAKLCNAD